MTTHNAHGNPLTEPEAKEAMRDPYELQPRYGHITLAVLSSILVLATTSRLIYVLRNGRRTKQNGFARNAGYRKAMALGRYMTSRQYVICGYYLPHLASCLVISSVSLFLFTWTWSVRPYYYSRWAIGSAPLAMRTGFMTAALFPYIFALSSKINVITFITGVSYEKLIVFHKAISWLFFFLGLIHTIPYLIQGCREMSPDGIHTQIELSWVKGKIYYPTGLGLNIVLAWLCFASLGVFRRKAYEFFKYMHVLAALAMLPLFVLHCNNQFDSWAYCFAGIAVYGFAVVVRFAFMLFRNSAGFPTATFEVLPSDMVRVTILANPLEHWKAGQHYFFNFAACAPFSSHPFTVASIPSTTTDREQKLVILMRKQAGLTKAIDKAVSNFQDPHKKTICFLDGPYGAILKTDLGIFDHVTLIAGGSGVSFTLPILQDLIQQVRTMNGTVCRSIHFIWCVRDNDAVEWVKEELSRAAAAAAEFLTISIHVTSSAMPTLSKDQDKLDESICCEGKETSVSMSDSIRWETGRPDLTRVVHAIGKRDDAQTAGIAVCGPRGMTHQVRTAVASTQALILQNQVPLRELFLHTEEFDW